MLLTVQVTTGRVALSIGSRGSTPTCNVNVTNPAARTLGSCTGVTWQVIPLPGMPTASVRISASLPCANAVPGAQCSAAADWVPSTFVVAVTAIDPALFSLTAGAPNAVLQLTEGAAMSVVQPLVPISNAAVTMLFQVRSHEWSCMRCPRAVCRTLSYPAPSLSRAG